MVNFNFSYAPGTSLQQMIGFEMAGRVWSSYLVDPVTVNVYVGVSSSLPSNVIGGALPGIRASQAYKDVVSGLQNDATSADDFSSLAALKGKDDYQAWFDAFDLKNGSNKGQTAKTKAINITSANAKALGINSGSSSDLDGVILFGGLSGTNYSWNYDYTRGSSTPVKTLDFLSTAMHEIGHVLGFVSGVDKPGWLNSTAADKAGVDQYKKSLSERISYTAPLDLFRYSTAAGQGVNDLSYGSTGSNKFFSIDGGSTAIAQFSTGIDLTLGGDGFQASHWKNSTTRTGIMAPALSPEERSWISATDLRAFDVIGWTLVPRAMSLNLDLSALQNQATTAIAQRLGVMTTWLTQNAATAAQQLGQDRSADVDRMIQNSQIYPWSSKPPGNGNGNGNGSGGTPPPNPWRQVLDLLSSQVVYSNFDTLDPEFSLTPVAQSQKSATFDFSVTQPPSLTSTLNPISFLSASFKLTEITLNPIKSLSSPTIEFADLQQWFEQLEKSLSRGAGNSKPDSEQVSQKSRRTTDWASVDWTSF